MKEAVQNRWVLALLVGNVILTLGVIGWAVWATTEPEYWFPGAFADEGPRGDEGPTGERGPPGRAGPTGEPGPGVEDAQFSADQAQSTADDALSQVEELGYRVDDLEGVDTTDLEGRVSDVEFDLGEICTALLEFDVIAC